MFSKWSKGQIAKCVRHQCSSFQMVLVRDGLADCPAMSFVFVCWHKDQKYKSVELGDQLGMAGPLCKVGRARFTESARQILWHWNTGLVGISHWEILTHSSNWIDGKYLIGGKYSDTLGTGLAELLQSDPYPESPGTHLMLAPDFFQHFCHRNEKKCDVFWMEFSSKVTLMTDNLLGIFLDRPTLSWFMHEHVFLSSWDVVWSPSCYDLGICTEELSEPNVKATPAAHFLKLKISNTVALKFQQF